MDGTLLEDDNVDDDLFARSRNNTWEVVYHRDSLVGAEPSGSLEPVSRHPSGWRRKLAELF